MNATAIQVLSAGAVKTGLRAAADAHTAAGGGPVELNFLTAPVLEARVREGGRADVVVAPPAALDRFAADGLIVAAARIVLGRVGVGVVVRAGAPDPDIGSVEALLAELRAARAIVFNRASTGIYLQGLLERLGVADALADRIERQPTGGAVMTRLAQGSGREIGFGATTEILVYRDRGVRLCGPLPAPIQNFTTYAAAPMAAASDPAAARDFVEFLAGSTGRRLLADSGIAPAPEGA